MVDYKGLRCVKLLYAFDGNLPLPAQVQMATTSRRGFVLRPAGHDYLLLSRAFDDVVGIAAVMYDISVGRSHDAISILLGTQSRIGLARNDQADDKRPG